MKKLVAIILCLSLLLLSFPMSASAAGPHDINVLAGEGGKIALTEGGPPESGNIAVNDSSNVTLYIIPESHYSIDDVMVDGFSEGAISQYTFNNVTSAHSISASFVRNTRTITVAAVENGEILMDREKTIPPLPWMKVVMRTLPCARDPVMKSTASR
jgi:hypothetical protein